MPRCFRPAAHGEARAGAGSRPFASQPATAVTKRKSTAFVPNSCCRTTPPTRPPPPLPPCPRVRAPRRPCHSRRFGLLFLLSRESKASSAGFAVSSCFEARRRNRLTAPRTSDRLAGPLADARKSLAPCSSKGMPAPARRDALPTRHGSAANRVRLFADHDPGGCDSVRGLSVDGEPCAALAGRDGEPRQVGPPRGTQRCGWRCARAALELPEPLRRLLRARRLPSP